MKQLHLKYAWLPALLVLTGCWKEPNFPKEPEIAFKSIRQEIVKDTLNNLVDRVYITLKFQDGDGNLGLSQEDLTHAPFNDSLNDPTKSRNYFLKAFIKDKGKFVEYPTLVFPQGYRFPRLSPTDHLQALEGDLTYQLDVRPSLIPFAFPDFKSGDSVKFEVYIKDRSLNKSNMVETEPVPIYEP